MNLHECILTKNDCYKTGRKINPKGVMVHSTGANNPNLKRYVQPDDGLLGTNNNGNSWNRSGLDVCVHAFIGKLADGTIATYQTLPWNYRAWHCGDSANNTHISFEICEDNLKDGDYFNAVYKEAVELTAYLCEMYGLDPMEDGVVICHSEGYERGIASGHADVMHWFPKHGKDMDDFREAVALQIKKDTQPEPEPEPETEDDDDMSYEKFKEYMGRYMEELSELEPSDWSKDAREWAEDNHYINGDENGRKEYKKFSTREELAQILYNIMG